MVGIVTHYIEEINGMIVEGSSCDRELQLENVLQNNTESNLEINVGLKDISSNAVHINPTITDRPNATHICPTPNDIPNTTHICLTTKKTTNMTHTCLTNTTANTPNSNHTRPIFTDTIGLHIRINQT